MNLRKIEQCPQVLSLRAVLDNRGMMSGMLLNFDLNHLWICY